MVETISIYEIFYLEILKWIWYYSKQIKRSFALQIFKSQLVVNKLIKFQLIKQLKKIKRNI